MRWAPLTGVAFIVVAIIAFAIGGEPPEADQPVREIVSHYVDNKDSIQVSSALAALAGVLLVFFAGYLRKVLQAAEGPNGFLSALVLTGAAIMSVGIAIDATIAFAIAEAADDIRPAGVQALEALWDNDFLPIALGTTVFLLSAGLSSVVHGGLPKWLGWIAIVLGIVSVTPIGFVSFLGGGLWVLATSVVLMMRGRPAAAAA